MENKVIDEIKDDNQLTLKEGKYPRLCRRPHCDKNGSLNVEKELKIKVVKMAKWEGFSGLENSEEARLREKRIVRC